MQTRIRTGPAYAMVVLALGAWVSLSAQQRDPRPNPRLAETKPPVVTELAAPEPLQLPLAITAQVPLTTLYNALNVGALAAGQSYLDPTTLARVYRLTSNTFPGSGSWGHDYSDGGDEVSLPHTGTTRTILVHGTGGYRLIDFTPGMGVSNSRALTGVLWPNSDLHFSFSNNPATPQYAYVGDGTGIRRFDVRTMALAPGNGWPVAGETGAAWWFHQSANDGLFVWMRGTNGGAGIVAYEPSTGTKKVQTNANVNEPRIDRGGRYVGFTMESPDAAVRVWDFVTNTVGPIWPTSGNTGQGDAPFAHVGSLNGRWIGSDWNLSPPNQFTLFDRATGVASHLPGPSVSNALHCNGNWIQNPPDPNDQWALCLHYGSLRPAGTWLAPGGMVLMTPNGQRRLLAHAYNTTGNYTDFSFAKFSPDGAYVLFTSNMNGAGRSDLFLAELPGGGGPPPPPDTTPPTVSFTAPANGAIVNGTTTVSANASDNVGVVGVQFKLNGVNLGAEDTTAPYSVSWNTTTVPNGLHYLNAIARDAAGYAIPAGIAVTVFNTGAPPPPPPALVEPVIWGTLVNVASWAGVLRKTGGCTGCADAAALSVQRIDSGDAYLEVEVPKNSYTSYVGFGTGQAGTATGNIRFGFRIQGTVAEVREQNTLQATISVMSGNILRVAVTDGVVTYAKNGTVFYTSLLVPSYPIAIDAALLDIGADVENAMIGIGIAPSAPSVPVTKQLPFVRR